MQKTGFLTMRIFWGNLFKISEVVSKYLVKILSIHVHISNTLLFFIGKMEVLTIIKLITFFQQNLYLLM